MITDTLISNLERALCDDPEARLATRHATFASLLEMGDESLLIKSREGSVTFVKDPTTDEPWDFAVRGSADAWKLAPAWVEGRGRLVLTPAPRQPPAP